MSEGKLILTPQEVMDRNSRDRKPFATLFSSDADLKRVFEKLDEVIWKSFGVDAQRDPFKQVKPSNAEIKHRFAICEAWIRHARGELNYSLDKTLDLMAHALRCELDGIQYEPEKSGSVLWSPT